LTGGQRNEHQEPAHRLRWAIVAVSGARAADAVVIAEPEPFEYVRVCDTYGAGFYYIPGTETCLRIGGLIRYDIEFSEDNEWEISQEDIDAVLDAAADLDPELSGIILDNFGDSVVDGILDGTIVAGDTIFQDGRDEGWAKDITARLNIDARSETEWGTFRRFIRLQGGNSHSATPEIFRADEPSVDVVYAYVELGGLLVGLYDTLYDGEMSWEFDNGGVARPTQIRYTFSGANGMTFQVSVEEQDYNYDYTPNVVGRIALTQGWGSLALFAAYDATFEEVGVKAIGSFNITDAIMLEAMATYESGFGDFSVSSANGMTGYEYSLAAALSFKATDRLTFWLAGQYFADQHWYGHDQLPGWRTADWVVVENLLLSGAVNYNGGDSRRTSSTAIDPPRSVVLTLSPCPEEPGRATAGFFCTRVPDTAGIPFCRIADGALYA